MPLPDTALGLLCWLERYARRIAFQNPRTSPTSNRVVLLFTGPNGRIEAARAPTLPAAILRAAERLGAPLEELASPPKRRRAKLHDQRQRTLWP